MIKKTNQSLTMKQLEHAVKRNFGGLNSNEVDALQIFKKRIHIPHVNLDRKEATVSGSIAKPLHNSSARFYNL